MPRITSLVLLSGGCALWATPLFNASDAAAAVGSVTLEFLRPVKADGIRLRAAPAAAGAMDLQLGP